MFRSYYNNYDDTLIPLFSTHDIIHKIIPRYHLNAELYKRIKFLVRKWSPPGSPPPSGRANTGQQGTNKAENGFVKSTIEHR